MEPLPIPADLGNHLLRDVTTFLGSQQDADTAYFTHLTVTQFTGWVCSVELSRRDANAVTKSQSFAHTFRSTYWRSAVLDICQALAACPSWTQGTFVFRDDHVTLQPGLEGLISGIFSVLRSSPSLSSLYIRLKESRHICSKESSGCRTCLEKSYTRDLPTLLCENPVLQTLTLTHLSLKDPRMFALCFSRNSVLKSCTLAVDFNRLEAEQWEVALRPFTTSSESEANVALKELVLEIDNFRYETLRAPCGEALANLVRCNMTLEKLVLLGLNRFKSYRPLAKALAVNHTLKEFGCNCGAASLKELLSVFIPDSSGHQANTHLTSLKLIGCELSHQEEFMKEVCRMLEFNSTLKHVEVVPLSPETWTRITPAMTGPMFSKALRLNTSLQSLVVVGYCTVLRVGGELQIPYGGPCLSMERPSAEYNVIVQMQQ